MSSGERLRGWFSGAVVIGLGLGLGLAACGYTFSASGRGLPGGVKVVDVPVLKNATTEANVEGLLTDSIRKRLVELGYAGEGGDRATLLATVSGVGVGPVAPKVVLSDAGNGVGYAPGLYNVTLAVSAKLMRGDELLWQADNVSLSEPYLPSDDLATLEAYRREALRRLLRDLAVELVTRLTSGF